jgi:hypothetical protein
MTATFGDSQVDSLLLLFVFLKVLSHTVLAVSSITATHDIAAIFLLTGPCFVWSTGSRRWSLVRSEDDLYGFLVGFRSFFR